MSALVTDDSEKQVAIDLTTTDELAIRENLTCRLVKIWISGTINGDGTIVLHKHSISGPVVFQLEANTAAATRFAIDVDYLGSAIGKESSVVSGKGFFIEELGAAWAAGSVMILYFDKYKDLEAA